MTMWRRRRNGLRALWVLGAVWACASSAALAQEPVPSSRAQGIDEMTAAQARQDASVAKRVVVVATETLGIDPVVGRYTTTSLRAALQEMGYEVRMLGEMREKNPGLAVSGASSPGDLWRVIHATSADRAVRARVWARTGRYVVELLGASADGLGPFLAMGSSSAEDLPRTVKWLAGQAVPPPHAWNARQAAELAEGVRSAQPPQPPASQPVPEDAETLQNDRGNWQLALQTEAAFGASEDAYYNHLVGARVAYRLGQRTWLGVYAAYASLRGKLNRAHNVLPYLQLESRVRISSSTAVTVPLRAALGYLPFNGPVARLSAGLNVPVSESVELGADIITPTFWFLPDGTTLSFNGAVEVIWRIR